MERITTVAGLKSAIQILEVEQNARERIMKDNLHVAYENLKPVNILKNTIRELLTPNYLQLNDNLAGTAVGAASGFFIRKFLVGSSGGLFRRLLGKVIQYTMKKVASNNSESITSAGFSFFNRLFQKKRRNPDERDTY